MSMSPLELYTIFCVIVGEDTPFPIKIAKTETVGILKKMIKLEKPKAFENIDPDELNLYRVEIDDDAELVENVKAKMEQSPSTLRATKRLDRIFETAPEDDTVHIIVVPPKITSTTPLKHSVGLPNINTSPPHNKDEIEKHVANFEVGTSNDITKYLESNTQLPLWQPQAGSNTVREHITALEIPALSTSSQYPSLLLHNLGRASHDALLTDRLDKLFRPGSPQKFLCNTSGSGKTRLLLEGLWRHWGFYFTARNQPDGVGSSDLENVLRPLKDGLRSVTTLTGESRDAALKANREVARRRFLQILYARLFIFRIFLDCASKLPNGITEEHKGRWLLMQVAPATLLGCDIFSALAQLVSPTPQDYLVLSIWAELNIIRKLGPQPLALFCVLDEAQLLTDLFSDCFFSETDPTQPRPILREIIINWISILPNLIVSGTGMSMQELGTVLGSVIAKEGGPPSEMVTDIGAFDDEKDQRGYLEQYLPQGFLDTDDGKAVAARVGYWLHGRHRFTATYLSHLIQSGFESPHRVLNDFVHGMTNFRPSDKEDGPPLAVVLDKPRGFDFSKLNKYPALLRQVAGFIFDYIFNGKPRGRGDPTEEKLVEYGVARFGKPGVIIADEPLALLAAVGYFETRTTWKLEYFLKVGLADSIDSARGIAFEHFGAYLLGLAFKSPRRLSDVFEFIGNNDLKDEYGQLVAIHKNIGGEFVCSPVDISSNMRPTYILGCAPTTEKDTLAWLKDPQRTVFCFPANTVGPDLILVLRLSDDSVVRVIVQFKQRTEMTAAETADAFRTTDPKCLLSQVARTPSATEGVSSPVRKRRQNGTSAQPKETRLKKPKLTEAFLGSLNALRVLATYPAKPHAHTLASLVEGDKSKHPAATLKVDALVANSSLEKIIAPLVAAAAMKKRKSQKRKLGDGDAATSKRQKTAVDVTAAAQPATPVPGTNPAGSSRGTKRVSKDTPNYMELPERGRAQQEVEAAKEEGQQG